MGYHSPFYQHGSTWIPAWITNRSKDCDEITRLHRWSLKWISNFTPHYNRCHYLSMLVLHFTYRKIKRHTAHAIVSWPNPKKWVIVHTSDLMMIIRQSLYIFSQSSQGKWVNWKHTAPHIVFLPLDIPSEYRPEHVTFGLLCVIFKFPSRIFCRRVPGFATDCPCGVWCRGLTTCLLYVGPPLEF